MPPGFRHATAVLALCLGGASIIGCPSADDTQSVDTDGSSTASGFTGTGAPTGDEGLPDATTADGGTTANDGGTATSEATGTQTGDASDSGTESSGAADTGVDPTMFVFDPADPDDYVQLDRAGNPAISTVLLLTGDQDAYNVATPAFDVQGADGMSGPQFWLDYADAIDLLHLGPAGMQAAGTGLQDDLQGQYTLCVPPQDIADNCFGQIIGTLTPDVVRLDLDDAPVFPNGRPLEAIVVDRLLAAIFVDLKVEPPDAFVDMDGDGTPGPSFNPIANDVPFEPFFPFLAPAHE